MAIVIPKETELNMWIYSEASWDSNPWILVRLSYHKTTGLTQRGSSAVSPVQNVFNGSPPMWSTDCSCQYER